jgi:protein-tyrosine phosphatase
LIDFHNHLLPGVDDGAADVVEACSAARAMYDAGVRTVVVTPHLQGSLGEQPDLLEAALARLDDAYGELREALGAALPELRLERGVELMLDSPRPDLSDPRLRLAGTDAVLVEFPWMAVPPHASRILYELRRQGWRPVVAHPERYAELADLSAVAEWRDLGCRLQLNHGSVVGRYGPGPRAAAWSLLERGWADYLCSDYHARGTLRVEDCRAALAEAGGEEQFRILTSDNPARLLAGEEPLAVPPLPPRPSAIRRLLGRIGWRGGAASRRPERGRG